MSGLLLLLLVFFGKEILVELNMKLGNKYGLLKKDLSACKESDILEVVGVAFVDGNGIRKID